MSDKSELLPCPFCGQQDAFVEQLDSDASVVICQGHIDEHSACLARGPVGVQESDTEDQPGKDAAIREWNRRAALSQQQSPMAMPDGWKLVPVEMTPEMVDVALKWGTKRSEWAELLAAAPAAPPAAEQPDTVLRDKQHATDYKSKFEALVEHCKRQDAVIAELRYDLNVVRLYQDAAVWFWAGDGTDNLETLACPVVINAGDLRALLGKESV